MRNKMCKGIKSRFSLGEWHYTNSEWLDIQLKLGNKKYRTKAIFKNHFVKIILSHYKMNVPYLEGIDEHCKIFEDANGIMKCYYLKYYFDIGIYIFIDIIVYTFSLIFPFFFSSSWSNCLTQYINRSFLIQQKKKRKEKQRKKYWM